VNGRGGPPAVRGQGRDGVRPVHAAGTAGAPGRHACLREITIPPGQATGWHYHDGPLYAFTQQGTLTHYDSTCASDGLYPKGSFIQEPAGPGNVHIGRNEGDTPIVLDVLYVLPHGAPFSQDAPNPGCPFE
jgi:quercetin dioxygenase-like cupin family protein